MIKHTTEFKHDLSASRLVDKIKGAHLNSGQFLDWLSSNRRTKYLFVHEKDEDIDAFMILIPKRVDGEPQVLIHSIYIPPESNGLSKEFYSIVEKMSKDWNISKIRARVTRRDKSIMRKWGFIMDSAILTKEIQ